MTLAEYDRLTPAEGEQYELYDGHVVALSTGTDAHGILCTRIATALDSKVSAPRKIWACVYRREPGARESMSAHEDAVVPPYRRLEAS